MIYMYEDCQLLPEECFCSFLNFVSNIYTHIYTFCWAGDVCPDMSVCCCCCLQSSVTEGLPVSILEAGLSGVCVVCTDVGGCSELLRDGPRNFGRLTSANNVQMIAYGQLEVMAMLPSLDILKLQQPTELDRDHLQALLHDPQVQQRCREWGQEYREFILSRFSISVHAMQQRQALYLSHFSQQQRNEHNKELIRHNTTAVLC